MKHTPGPWEVINNYVKKVGGGVIATTARNNASCRFEAGVASYENGANARLIASAPELLEALQEAANELHGLWGDGEVCTEEKPCMYCAAIARAEGE